MQYEILDSDDQRVLSYTNNMQGYYNLLQCIKSASFYMQIDNEKLPKDNNLKLKISYNNEGKIKKEIIINFRMDKIFENSF